MLPCTVPAAIEIDWLTKRYGRKLAVDNLTLQVPTGSIFGLLGNNGAGKTSTIRMLVGHLYPTSGAVRLLGKDHHGASESDRRRMAYLSDRMKIPGWMHPRTAIAMNQSLYPLWDAPLAERLMDRFRLRQAGRFGRLSFGERRKVMLLITLCQGAELLILDEPTLGLDVESRHVFLECLLDFACQGNRTVLLSSHLLSDVERVVDRVAMLRDGRLITQGVLEDLKEGIRKLHIPTAVSRDELSVHFKILSYDGTQPRQTVATVADFTDDKLNRMVGGQPQARELRAQRFNLEDIFVALMNSAGE